MAKRKVVIAGACRTAIGKFGGTLKDIPATKLGEIVIREAMKRAGIEPSAVDEVLMGNVIQAGNGQNPARQAAVNAGIPVEVPATTINVLCGSGLDCVNMAAKLIENGDADVVVAGGMENMDAAPYLLYNARFGYRMNAGKLDDAMIRDALTDAFGGYHMGITAENIAERWHLTREQLDEFAFNSQQKAKAAIAAGKFKDEIVPVEVPLKHGKTLTFDTDEGPRDTTMEALAKLRPAFKEGGVVTAGNASGINDAAAAMIVLSEDKAKELGVTPMATWIGGELAGVDPAIMGIGPVYATRKTLKKLKEQGKADLTIDDFDLYEANEAFAAQSVAVAHDLGFNPDKLNVNGGAIALGHPVGCSGARILVTRVGGGMGGACVVER